MSKWYKICRLKGSGPISFNYYDILIGFQKNEIQKDDNSYDYEAVNYFNGEIPNDAYDNYEQEEDDYYEEDGDFDTYFPNKFLAREQEDYQEDYEEKDYCEEESAFDIYFTNKLLAEEQAIEDAREQAIEDEIKFTHYINLWHPIFGKLIKTISIKSESFNPVAFSPDGSIFANIKDDTNIELWRWKTREIVDTFIDDNLVIGVTTVAFGSGNIALASGSIPMASDAGDACIKVWGKRKDDSAISKQPLLVLSEEPGHIGDYWVDYDSIAISSDGRFLFGAVNGTANSFRLWELEKGNLISTFMNDEKIKHCVDIGPDDILLAGGCDDGTVLLSNMEQNSAFLLRDHQEDVRVVKFSPAGNVLASGGGAWSKEGSDFTIRLWNCIDGSLISRLEGHNFAVTHLAFSYDGNLLASADKSRNIIVWRKEGQYRPNIKSKHSIEKRIEHNYWETLNLRINSVDEMADIVRDVEWMGEEPDLDDILIDDDSDWELSIEDTTAFATFASIDDKLFEEMLTTLSDGFGNYSDDLFDCDQDYEQFNI